MLASEMLRPVRGELEVRLAHDSEPQWYGDSTQVPAIGVILDQDPLVRFAGSPLHVLQNPSKNGVANFALKFGMGRVAVLEKPVKQA
jgi:hypothetical protein